MVTKRVLLVLATAVAIAGCNDNEQQNNYNHSLPFAGAEPQFFKVDNSKVVGPTVNYTIIDRENGYGVVHNLYPQCAPGESEYKGACYSEVSAESICGKYVPELRITRKENELFDISCELELDSRANQNLKDGVESQVAMDAALSSVRGQMKRSDEGSCGNYATAFSNENRVEWPSEVCIPKRVVTEEWQCPNGWNKDPKIIVHGKLVTYKALCSSSVRLTEEQLRNSCPDGYSLNEKGTCWREVDVSKSSFERANQ